jgi:iron complex outermembrane receptor protein
VFRDARIANWQRRGSVDDAWTQGQVGFRADWERGADRFSVNGNANRGASGQPAPGVIAAPAANPAWDVTRAAPT